MRKLLAVLLAMGLALPAAGGSATVTHTALFVNLDLAGEATDVDQVTLATLIVDSAAQTVIANPDIPRILTISLVDADDSVSAGSMTITGTDDDGNFISETVTGIGSAAGADADATVNAFATVISATNGVYTGEGAGDTVSVGVVGAPPVLYPILTGPRSGGLLSATAGNPDNAFNPNAPFGWFRAEPAGVSSSAARIETSGWSTTIVSSTGGSSDLRWVDIGDQIKVIDNTDRERILTVITNADNDTITVDQGVNLGTDGVGYYYKKLRQFNGNRSGWFSVDAARQFTVMLNLDDLEADISYRLDCRPQDAAPDAEPANVVGPTTVANGSEAVVVITRTDSWSHCRLGVNFTVGDAGADSISAYVTIYYE